MDEQRLEAYLNLIEELLNCSKGEEREQSLRNNANLIDEGLVTVMELVVAMMAEEGDPNVGLLQKVTAQLAEALKNWRHLNEQSVKFYQQGQYAEAVNFAGPALELARRLWGEGHPYVATSLNNLAALYRSMGRYSEAEPLCQQTLALRRQLLGEAHPSVATSQNALAELYRLMGRYSEAKPLYEEAIALMQQLPEEAHPALADSLNNLGILYHAMGRYSKAESLLKQALVLRRQLLGEAHPDVADSLNNLAELYRLMGRYSEAETLYEEALALMQQLLVKAHPSVATSLNNLACLFYSMGRYSEAEPLFQRALALKRQLLAEAHPDVATSLNNLAGLYHEIEQYSEAETRYQQALNLRLKLLGEEHPDVAISLNNLASLYSSMGRYREAKLLFQKALKLRLKLLGKQHYNVATSLNNLAGLYHSMGLYNKAKRLFQQALALRRHLLGEAHPNVADSLNNLGLLFYSMGGYSEADPLYQQALVLRRQLLGEAHPAVATSYNNLAVLLAATYRPIEALEMLRQASEVEDRIIRRVFATSSERERLAHLERERATFEKLLSLVLNYLRHSPEAVQTALDVVLKRKCLTAAAQAAQNEALYSGRYPHLTAQFQQLRSLSDQIIHLTYSQPETYRLAATMERLAQLQAEFDNLERLLASQVPEIQLQDRLADRRAVALELPEGSTLLEFVCFNVYDLTAKQIQPARYVAFVLPSQQPDAVQMIDLGEAEPIDRLIKEFRASASLGGGNLESRLEMWDTNPEPAPAFPQYNPAGFIPLRQAIFDRIRPALTGCKSLIVSPDGELNLLPFQILPNDDAGKTLLRDEYSISYLSVGRDILRSTVQPNRPASVPLIMADPDFDLAVRSQDFSPPSAKALTTNRDQILSTLDGKAFERAPGTRYLGESVAKKLNQQPYLDKNALETHLKTSQCPHILLLATHGVFLSDSPQEPPTFEFNSFNNNRLSAPKANNPMMRSGIALAGANTWIAGGDLPPDAGKGFLFAQDVAALDLWANELTVLSACNTAIGDVKIGEGVFGLRRAFAIAGAKTLVMSLWPVPDRATALLMQRFFDNLQRGLGRADALHEAQNYLRTITVGELRQFPLGMEVLDELLAENSRSCQEDDTPLSHPFYWGAWVCQGDTTPFRVEFAGAPN